MAEHFISIDEARKDILACATYLAEDLSSNDGRAEAMSTIVPIYLERKNVDLAAELANTIDDPFFRDQELSAVAEKCAEIGDSEYAFQLVNAIEDRGYNAAAAEKIARIFADVGDLENARTATELLEHPDFARVEIATAIFRSGDKTGAADFLARVDFATARAVGYENFAELEEDTNNAVHYLQQAESCVDEMEHGEEIVQTYLAISRKYLSKNRNAQAIETAEKARAAAEKRDSPQRDMLFASIALAFFNAGSENLADRALDICNDKTQTAACLLGFAQTYARRGEKSEAVDALNESFELLRTQSEKETRSTGEKANTFASVAFQFAEFGDFAMADKAASEIPVEKTKEATYLRLVAMAVLAEDTNAAEAFIAIFEWAEIRFQALLAAFTAARSLQNEAAADMYFARMRECLEEVTQVTMRPEFAMTCAHIANARGDKSAALAYFDDAMRNIREIRDEARRASLLAELGVAIESNGMPMTEYISNSLRVLIR